MMDDLSMDDLMKTMEEFVSSVQFVDGSPTSDGDPDDDDPEFDDDPGTVVTKDDVFYPRGV